MSRHIIRDDARYRVVVGWDPPFATFFGQVFDREIDDWDANPVVDIGSPEKVTLDEVAEAISPWSDLPQAARERLRADSTS